MEYIIYERSESGSFTRTGRVVDSEVTSLNMGDEVEERLVGWPERTVYWTNDDGVAIGYALKRGQ
jgi:hypothetical protein